MHGSKKSSSIFLQTGIVFLVAVCWRIIAATPISTADIPQKWAAAVDFSRYGVLPEFNHQTLRWASNFPVAIIQLLLGYHPVEYYIWPIFLSGLSAVFAYLIGRTIYSSQCGYFCAFIITLYPPMRDLGCQLFPEGNMLPFVLGATYFILIWERTKLYKYLIISGLMLFIGYGAKITALLYVAPICFYILYVVFESHKQSGSRLSKASYLPVVVFSAVIVVGILIETVTFYLISGFPYGTVIKSMQTHATETARLMGYGTKAYAPYGSFTELLISPVEYLGYDFSIAAAILSGICISLLIFIKKARALYLFVFLFVFDFLFSSYAIRSVNPILLAQPRLPRYTLIFCIIGILMLAMFIYNYVYKAWFSKINFNIFISGLTAIFLVSILIIKPNEIRSLKYFFEEIITSTNNVVETHYNEIAFNNAMAGHTPIVAIISYACTNTGNMVQSNNMTKNGTSTKDFIKKFYAVDSTEEFNANNPEYRFCENTKPFRLYFQITGDKLYDKHKALMYNKDTGSFSLEIFDFSHVTSVR